jgi:hypothetical protein
MIAYLVQSDQAIIEKIHNFQLAAVEKDCHVFVLQPPQHPPIVDQINDLFTHVSLVSHVPQVTYLAQLHPTECGCNPRYNASMSYWYWLSHSPSSHWQALQLYHSLDLEWSDFWQAACLAQELHRHEIQQLRVQLPDVPIALLEIAQQFYSFVWTDLN